MAEIEKTAPGTLKVEVDGVLKELNLKVSGDSVYLDEETTLTQKLTEMEDNSGTDIVIGSDKPATKSLWFDTGATASDDGEGNVTTAGISVSDDGEGNVTIS